MAYGKITPSPGASQSAPPEAATPSRAALPGRRARVAYRLLAFLFAACILVQVFAAGMAIFVDPGYWGWHRGFGHTLELLPLIMLALAFPARLSSTTRWMTAGLFGLLIAQIATVNIGAAVAALHPVNAIALFFLSVTLAQRARRERAAAPIVTPTASQV